MRLYFAAPLFDEMERRRNLEECTKLEEAGFTVYLPQRDAGEVAVATAGKSEEVERLIRKQVFQNDIKGIRNAHVVIAYLDGRVPDEGTVFECGYAYALMKPVIYVHTDDRSFMKGHLNVMLEKSGLFYSSTEEAIAFLEAYEEAFYNVGGE